MFATTSPRLTFCPYEEVEFNKLLFETEEVFFCSLGGGCFVLKFFPTEREVFWGNPGGGRFVLKCFIKCLGFLSCATQMY